MRYRRIQFFIAPILIGSFFTASPSTRDAVKRIIEDSLHQQNRSVYDIPSSLDYEYERALDGADLIDDFLSEMNSIVLASEVESYIDKRINKILYKNNLSRSDIPASLSSKFEKKRKSIIKKAKDEMWYYSNESIKKTEIKDIVSSKINYSFIKEIKDAKNSSSWSIGNAITSIVAELFSSTNNNSSSSSSFTTYYSHMCPICQDDFFGAERVGVLSCGHCFHPECIKQALSYKKECPVCRKKDVYLAKIYDSKEHVPGYYPTATEAAPSAPDYEPYLEPTPEFNPDYIPEDEDYEPSAPDFDDLY